MNAIELLKKDHQKIKDILESIANSRPTALKTREKLINKLYDLISLHAALEEKLIYPLGMKHTALKNLTREAYEGHKAVEVLLKKALKIETNDESWLAKCIVIKENLEHHLKEEEENMLPALSKILSKDDLADIGKKMLIFKEKHIMQSA